MKSHLQVENETQKAIDLYLTGQYTIREIAEMLGVTKQALSSRFNRRGIRTDRLKEEIRTSLEEERDNIIPLGYVSKIEERVRKLENLLSTYKAENKVLRTQIKELRNGNI